MTRAKRVFDLPGKMVDINGYFADTCVPKQEKRVVN